MSLTTYIQVTDQDTRSTAATQGGEDLGQLARTADGKVYAYTLAGASNLAAGKITQTAASVANSVNRTGVTTVAGQNSVAYTLGATAVTADQYKGGYLVVNAGTGAGQSLLISGNTAATAGNSYAITVYLTEAIMTATLASDSKFSLLPNPQYSSVIADHTAQPSIPVNGVPIVAVTAAYYYWSQVGGYASVLSDGVIAKNAEGIGSNGTDGAVETRVDATVTKAVGYAPEATVTTEYSPFVLTLAY